MTPGARGKRTTQVELWDRPLPSFSENSALWSVSCAGFFFPWKGFQVVLAVLAFIIITLSGQSPTHADSYPEDLAGAAHCLDSPFHPPAST